MMAAPGEQAAAENLDHDHLNDHKHTVITLCVTAILFEFPGPVLFWSTIWPIGFIIVKTLKFCVLKRGWLKYWNINETWF